MVKVLRLDEQIDDRSRRDSLIGIAKDYFLSDAKRTGKKPDVGSSHCEGDDSYAFYVHYKPDSDTNVTIAVRPLRNQLIVEFSKNFGYAIELAKEFERRGEPEFSVIKTYRED